MRTAINKPSLRLLWLACAGAMSGSLWAQEQKLPEVQVTAEAPEPEASAQINQQRLSAAELSAQQASQLADVVRYSPGVTLTNIGRFGSAGFNIRGMDGDRVAITVDGLALAERLDPSNLAPYAFFRSGRGGIELDSLKQVEILKGADALLAGSGSLGGAVLLQTKDPADFLQTRDDESHLGLKAGFDGAFHERQLNLTAANRLGAVESMLILSRRDGEQQRVPHRGADITGGARSIPEPLDSQSHNLLAKLQWQLQPEHRLGWTLEHYTAITEVDERAKIGGSYLSRDTEDESRRRRAGMAYEWLAGKDWFDAVSLRLDWQDTRNFGITKMLMDYALCPEASQPCMRHEDRGFRQRQQRLALAFDKELLSNGLQQQWLYGIGAERKHISSWRTNTHFVGNSAQVGRSDNFAFVIPHTRIDQWYLMARDQLTLAGGSQWTLGLRYDGFRYQPELSELMQDGTDTITSGSFGNWSGQLSYRYPLTERQQLKLQWGRGFRMPSVDDMYGGVSSSVVTDVNGNTAVIWNSAANPELKAETSRNLELAWSWQPAARQQLQLSVFRQDYRNLIESQPQTRLPDVQYQRCAFGDCILVEGNTYWQPQNIGQARVQGIELESLLQLNQAFSLRLAGSRQYGKDSDDEPLLSITPANALAALRYQHPSQPWQLVTTVQYLAAKNEADTLQTQADGSRRSAVLQVPGSATVVDLNASWDITAAWQLQLGIFNLFDREYYRWDRLRFIYPGGGGPRGDVQPDTDGYRRFAEPGRYLKASVSYTF
ncbi:MAG: TonB-dependent hemoglobin/transferrin/lactoferrin family receptor [Alkalimonas sp.]|nr:TonB-dependent hemoglobin/transferrin/lactoferrin family receptor [Alkalimonas sp.]